MSFEMGKDLALSVCLVFWGIYYTALIQEEITG